MATFSVLILTAAPPGLGAETGGGFMKIDGREAILRTAELFLNRDNVKQVQVVFLPDEAEEGKRKYGTHLGLFGVKTLVGGPRWIDQIAAAAPKIEPDATHVIVHDAARPAVPYTDIDALMEAAANKPVVALAMPVRNNLAEVDEGGNALAFSPPSRFMQLLAPQAFSLAAFKEMATSKKDPHASAYTLLKGSPLNIRIGGPADAHMAKTMLNMLPKPKSKGMTNPFEEAQW